MRNLTGVTRVDSFGKLPVLIVRKITKNVFLIYAFLKYDARIRQSICSYAISSNVLPPISHCSISMSNELCPSFQIMWRNDYHMEWSSKMLHLQWQASNLERF